MPPSDYLRAGGRAEPASADPAVAAVERPAPAGVNAPAFGSDVVADTLRVLDIPYIALKPGASYRGLHDSLVNFLGNSAPQMLLCLHEENAVAIAHGYAKVTGKADGRHRPQQCRADARDDGGVQRLVRPRADAGARRDRAGRRRQAAAVDRLDPYRADQGALVRNYTKWDDQPASVRRRPRDAAARRRIATTPPLGPVYVCLDAGLQEAKLGDLPPLPTPSAACRAVARPRRPIWRAKAAADCCNRPSGRDPRRARLAQRGSVGAPRRSSPRRWAPVVLTDPKTGATFPTRTAARRRAAGNDPARGLRRCCARPTSS